MQKTTSNKARQSEEYPMKKYRKTERHVVTQTGRRNNTFAKGRGVVK